MFFKKYDLFNIHSFDEIAQKLAPYYDKILEFYDKLLNAYLLNYASYLDKLKTFLKKLFNVCDSQLYFKECFKV